MQPKYVDEFQARVTLPHSTHTITGNDLNIVQAQVRAACKAADVQVNFDKNSPDSTVQLLDEHQRNIGNIHIYQVAESVSVSNLLTWRKSQAA